VPYLLVAPIVVVLAAILGYPIYYLVRISLQKYDLFALVAHHGTYIGLGTRCSERSSSRPSTSA
jgi:ABC-type sugar transport system permease subunit